MQFRSHRFLFLLIFSLGALLKPIRAADLYVGSNNSGETTNFTSGTNRYSNTYVGYSSSASNNLLTISSTNTLLFNTNYLYVGYDGSSNSMVISNGGRVTDSNGYIGYSNGANGNTVTVTGSNSSWTNIGGVGVLYVGYEGSSNSLNILDGARVRDVTGYVGFTNSSDNSVLVSGSGSTWMNVGALRIGLSNSSGNSLVISNSARVVDATGYVGFDQFSSNNSVLVTSNASWNSSSTNIIGYAGSGNTLTISGGGTVTDTEAFVGYMNTSSNNSVTLTGGLWSNSGDFFLGYNGSGSLTIGGGTLTDFNGWIGYSSSANNNSVLVTGSNALWSNSQQLSIGNLGSDNSLIISNGGRVMNGSNGFAYGLIGAGANSSNNFVVVTGTGSLWSMSDALSVGSGPNSSGNSLTISNGGKVQAADQSGNGVAFYIGGYGAANSNRATVTGPGSLFAVIGDAWVSADDNSGNQLSVLNGASMTASNLFVSYVPGGSSLPASSNNSVVISGSSTVTLTGDTYVGWGGHNDTMTIASNGVLSDVNGWIGYTNTATNHSALVTGSNSLWSNSGTLTIGYLGGGNTLSISDGGSVTDTTAYIGSNSTSSNNSVLVTGTNSLWTNSGDLFIGNFGSSNTLNVAGGGRVLVGGNINIGSQEVSFNNIAVVTGSNTLLSNSSSLVVGRLGSYNSLLLNAGAQVRSGADSSIGAFGSNNSVLVSDNGTLWTNAGDLSIGFTGSFNNLTVSNGATVGVQGGDYLMVSCLVGIAVPQTIAWW